MTSKNNSEITIELLRENHPIKPFDCEDDDLNDFLFNKALLYQKELLATTFVIESEKRTLGYYSVLNDSLQLKEEDFPSKSKYKKFLTHLIPHPKRHLKSVPAVKIGRLAIDKACKGMGLGRLIIRNLIADCVKLNQQIACRLITVDAYKGALTFYQKLGFEFLTEKDNNEDIRQMFFDLTNLDN